MAFSISNLKLKSYIDQYCPVPTGAARLIGIRGAVPTGPDSLSLRGNQTDHWNDTIGIWGGSWGLFQGTVEPGRFYTQNPMNPQGAAHLVPVEVARRPWTYQWGTHKGYRALVQAEKFSVRRDRDRDGIPEPSEPIETGFFGIHVHWGGSNWSVGKWSAGCQVLFGGDGEGSQWRAFKKMLQDTGQSQFSYFLIDGRALAQFLGAL